MKKSYTCLLIALFATMHFTPQKGMAQYAIPAKMNWWYESRFGMFIHLGSYSYLANGEWAMSGNYSKNTYQNQVSANFNPTSFNAGRIARLAKKAGMKYLVITAKHHEGFCMWDTQVASFKDVTGTKDYDLPGFTAFKTRDLLRELKDSCDAVGVKFCLYYSILDWNHSSQQISRGSNSNNWYTFSTTASATARTNYIADMKAQLKELIDRYHPALLWFDGDWTYNFGAYTYGITSPDKWWTKADGEDLQNYLRGLDPNLLMNERVFRGAGLGDWVCSEGTILDSPDSRPWETCQTMNNSWGYNSGDNKYKTTQILVRELVQNVSRDGNYLLNIGPKGDGTVPNESVSKLDSIGDWMAIYSKSIYGTTRSPFSTEPAWGLYTKKNGKLYTHVFSWPKNGLVKVPSLKNTIKKIYLLSDTTTSLSYKDSLGFIRISVPEKAPNIINSVIVIEVSGLPVALIKTTPIVNAQSSVQNNLAKRTKENFDQSWQFHKGDIAIKREVKAGGQGGLTDVNVKVISTRDTVIDYANKNNLKIFYSPDWKEIDVPHDWVVEGTFVNDNTLGNQPAANGYLPGGIGFYRKEFEIPATDLGRKISIEFDGIFRNSTVWVNGHLLGNHQSGYTPSNYDLTDVLRYGNEGKNVILVRVDASEYEGWWYEGGGIYRHAWLVKTDKLHVGRFGTFVTTPSVSADLATVNVKTTLSNEYKTDQNVTLRSRIVDSKGVVLDTKKSSLLIKSLAHVEVSQEGTITRPLLWSPETPSLYKIVTEVWDKENLIDTYETTFGVRTIEFNRNGFFLNGKLYPVKGTSNHQDFAGLGVALPDKINWYKLKLLKEVGCNGYRTHHPSTPEMLNMCDSIGILVLAENRRLSSAAEGLEDLKTMLYRDRNHPSIIIWSMENEEWLQGSITGTRILETLVETTHSIDSTRPVTAAMNHGRNDGGYSDVLDVTGYNYGDKQLAYVKDHENYPARVVFCTESTSFVSTRGEYQNDWGKGFVSNLTKWQPDWGPFPGEDWADIVKYPFLGGTFVWTGFDYRGEPTPYQWPCVTSHFGFMDICGFPKDGYYAYKAAWTLNPVVHIFPHWNWPGKEGTNIQIHSYTNCEEVELFLNGKSIGKQKTVPYQKLIWDLVYQPGKLEARGYKNGKIIAKDIVETTTAPSQVTLTSDCSTLKADDCDVAVIKVAIRDTRGRVVPIADNLVKFSIEGPGKIIGTGNGNPSSHEPDKASQRKAFNGYCLVMVQAGKQAGEIRLKASSDLLKSNEIIIKIK